MRNEIESFSDIIAEKEEIAVLNKIDTVDAHDALILEFAEAGIDILPISAEKGFGIDELKTSIRSKLDNLNMEIGSKRKK